MASNPSVIGTAVFSVFPAVGLDTKLAQYSLSLVTFVTFVSFVFTPPSACARLAQCPFVRYYSATHSMHFHQELPSPDLASFVERTWILQGNGLEDMNRPERILPDGCMELVIHFGTPFERLVGGRWKGQPAAIVVGQMTSATILRAVGAIDALGVTLRPEAALNFAGIPGEALTDSLVPAESVSHYLGQCLTEIRELGPEKGKGRLQSFLRDQFAGRVVAPPTVRAAVSYILRTAGMEKVEAVARTLGVTERQLQRLFARHVGLTPKQFSRIVRFQSMLRASERSDAKLLAVALQQGYYDQAHLVHEFQSLAGAAPVALLERLDKLTRMFLRHSCSMSGFYNTYKSNADNLSRMEA
jgi:AraC-like DNA-binding protein